MKKPCQQLLVMTALEETWGAEESVLFLGEWCKLYERRDVWTQRKCETVPFHWDDRKKVERDYFYLKSLHHKLLECLAATLNELHQVNHNLRYWQILLDPWLLTYVSVAFDRWECLRIAVETNDELHAVFLRTPVEHTVCFSYAEFLTEVLSDEWNQYFYQRILETEYSKKCVVRIAEIPSIKHKGARYGPGSQTRPSLLGKMALIGDRFLGSLVRKQDVVFLDTKLSLAALIRLNFALGQVPRLYLSEFASSPQETYPSDPRETPIRTCAQVGFDANSQFEKFIKNWVLHDLPTCFIEHYSALRARARDITIRTKAIVTAGNHWIDAFAKCWFAEQVNKGVKFIIAEHGGSLPPYGEHFDFEDNIADAKATWFRPYQPNQMQLPAAKIIGRFKKARPFLSGGQAHRYCSVIGNECARWAYRIQFYPMAGQWSHSFNMVLEFHENLDENIKKHFRIKPYPSDQGWSTKKRFLDIFGSDKVIEEKNIDTVFFQSRVIVCTYPETTFAEAMASGVPTILVYPDQLYELNPIALPLLDTLKSANIVFDNAKTAANHLNIIWKHPHHWWNSDLVRRARVEFNEQALNIDLDWLPKWRAFLQGMVAEVA